MWTIFKKIFIEFVTMLFILCFNFLAVKHVGSQLLQKES